MLLYHETSSTKTTQKLVSPEFLLNQFTVYKSVKFGDNLTFGRKTL